MLGRHGFFGRRVEGDGAAAAGAAHRERGPAPDREGVLQRGRAAAAVPARAGGGGGARRLGHRGHDLEHTARHGGVQAERPGRGVIRGVLGVY